MLNGTPMEIGQAAHRLAGGQPTGNEPAPGFAYGQDSYIVNGGEGLRPMAVTSHNNFMHFSVV